MRKSRNNSYSRVVLALATIEGAVKVASKINLIFSVNFYPVLSLEAINEKMTRCLLYLHRDMDAMKQYKK